MKIELFTYFFLLLWKEGLTFSPVFSNKFFQRKNAINLLKVRSTPAPKTGFQTVRDELRDEALSYYFDQKVTCKPTSGGVNNMVNYVETENGNRYILRIYNNGNNSPRVKFEHDILRELSKIDLSFEIPKTLPSLKDRQAHVLLSSGTEACVFEVIPGALPKTASPTDIGRAAGELNSALEKIDVDISGCAPPYYDLWDVHHAITREIFYDQVQGDAYECAREAMTFLVSEIKQLESKLELFKSQKLPKQIIHGDLHFDNVLCLDDQVSGLLDFEFCAYDWRAMELAICLSKYAGEQNPLPLFQQFIQGFLDFGRLTAEEVKMIPDLINLRILSNVVYFVGRAVSQEDTAESLTSRAASYAKRVQWINENKQDIIDFIAKCTGTSTSEPKA